MIDAAGEELVTLRSGAVVLKSVFEFVQALRARGHVIRVAPDKEDRVVVEPNISDDGLYILDSNLQDTQDILDDASAPIGGRSSPSPCWPVCSASMPTSIGPPRPRHR